MRPEDPLAEFVSSVDALRAWYEARGEQITPSRAGFQVMRRLTAEIVILLEVTWNADRGIVHFRAGLPVRIPADRRAAGAELVRHANARVAVGAFRLGDEGWVVFGYEAILNHDATLSTRAAELATELCTYAARGLLPTLADLVAGAPQS